MLNKLISFLVGLLLANILIFGNMNFIIVDDDVIESSLIDVSTMMKTDEN